jgi:hypothetical protein
VGKALILLVGVVVGAELLRRLTAAAELEPESDAADASRDPRGTDDSAG